MKTISLAEGANLLLIPEEKFKTTTLCLLVRRPLSRQEATWNACLPWVLKRGCAKYPTLSRVNEAAEAMYGAVFHAQVVKKGEEQLLQFLLEFVRMPGEDMLAQGAAFLREIVYNPLVENEAFPEEVVKGALVNVRNAIEDRINDKAEYAKLKCLEIMCRDEPFGLYGDGYLEDLEQIDGAKLYAHYRNILRTSLLEIAVTGNEPEENARREAAALLPPERGEAQRPAKPENRKKTAEEQRSGEKTGLTQGKLCIGLRTAANPASQEIYKLLVANELLGGGANSRLFVNVREKESLCYYINAIIYQFKAIMLIQSGVDAGNFDHVISLIRREISVLQNDEYSDEELANAKKSAAKKFLGAKDYPAVLTDFYVSQRMLGTDTDLDGALEMIGQTTRGDVKTAAEGLCVDTIFTLA